MTWKEWVLVVLLLLLGILALAKLIVARAPNAGQIFAKIGPYQGFIGIAGLAFGLFLLIEFITGSLGFRFIVYFAAVLVIVVLGAHIGWALMKGQLGGKAATQGEQIEAKLSKQQTNLGLAALGLAILLLILSL